MSAMPELDRVDRAIIAATQGGLPLAQRPFQAVAREIGLTESEVIARMAAMQAAGVIRRVAAVPNHYALGLSATGMSDTVHLPGDLWLTGCQDKLRPAHHLTE
jgi:DNA-binding Lrp family transcriptional regulator